MYRFDPFNYPAEQERRKALLARFPAAQRLQKQLQQSVQRMQSQFIEGNRYHPEFLADMDAIITQAATLDRLHDDIAREINGAITQALAEGDITPADVGAGLSSLGLLPVIAALSAKVVGYLVGGLIVGYLGKSLFDAIERLLSGQSQLMARINAAKSLSDAYAEYYKKNPKGTAPEPAELLKLFPPTEGHVAAALNFGTLTLIVGGIYFASKALGGKR